MEYVQPIRSRKKVDAMKAYLHDKSLRDYCLFVLGVNSGLRVSDLLSLNIEDVTDSSGKPVERIAIRESKTGKCKEFPLSQNARKALCEYLATRTDAEPDDPLFLSKKGGPITRVHAWTVLNEAAEAVGIKESIGTHTLRKTFAYHAYKAGTDITMLMKLLNHSTPGITLRYIGITQDQLDDVHLSVNL